MGRRWGEQLWSFPLTKEKEQNEKYDFGQKKRKLDIDKNECTKFEE